MKSYPTTYKNPKKVHSKEERVTSDWLEFLKTLTPKLQKKEHCKREIRERHAGREPSLRRAVSRRPQHYS